MTYVLLSDIAVDPL